MRFVFSQNLLSANDSDYHAGLALFNPTTWNNDAARFFSKSEPTRELQREIGAKQGFPWFKFIIDPTSDHDSDSMVSICSFHHPGQWQKNTVSYPGRKNCPGHLHGNIFQIIVSYFDLAGAAPVVPKLTLPLVESIRGNINRTEVIVQMWGQQQADQSPLYSFNELGSRKGFSDLKGGRGDTFSFMYSVFKKYGPLAGRGVFTYSFLWQSAGQWWSIFMNVKRFAVGGCAGG